MTFVYDIPTSKFDDVLKSSKIDNPYFDINQFKKHYDSKKVSWCMLFNNDGQCIAAANVDEGYGPTSQYAHINEIQCLVKGNNYWKKLLRFLKKHYAFIWLCANPEVESDALLKFYRDPEFKFSEYVVPANESIYQKDTHIFAVNGRMHSSMWMDFLKSQYCDSKNLNESEKPIEQIDFKSLFDEVVNSYKNKFNIDLSYMDFKVDTQPVYNNGEPCFEYQPDECAGDQTKLKYIRLNPDMKSVIDRYEIEWHQASDINNFAKTIIAHELAHEVWNNIADDSFKRQMLQQAKRHKFSTPYLKTVRLNKLDEETFCEWLANLLCNTYEPPYTLEQIKANYPENIYLKLKSDPIHSWRAKTGIELIHREPDEVELDRIWRNWQLMPNSMKKISDKKSYELFGCANDEHYKQLKKQYQRSRSKYA